MLVFIGGRQRREPWFPERLDQVSLLWNSVCLHKLNVCSFIKKFSAIAWSTVILSTLVGFCITQEDGNGAHEGYIYVIYTGLTLND